MTATSGPGDTPPAAGGRPDEVERLDEALVEWLGSFIVPEALGAEMASACAAGAAWAAAIGAGAVRRAGWPDAEALAWGVTVGGLAGALEAGRRSLAASEPGGRGSEGHPAHALLASDGLVAAAHEALSTITPERLGTALETLAEEFGDGGPWRRLSGAWPGLAWPVLVPCAMGPAAAEQPDGPWRACAEAWRVFDEGQDDEPAATRGAEPPEVPPAELWRQPGADRVTRALLRAAALEARAIAGEAGAGA